MKDGPGGLGCTVEVMAHRGFSGIAPENTLAAFLAAMEAGADRLELDILLSADGVPVVIHDADLDRTTDGKGPVASRTLAQIRRLDAGAWFHPRFRGERVPTLDEVLDACRGRIAVNLEIKHEAVDPDPAGSPHGVEAKVAAAVRRRAMANSVVVSSFDPICLGRLRSLAPEIPTQSLFDGKRQQGLGPLAVCAAVGSHAFNCSLQEATAETIAEAHAAGIRVNVYTVNDPPDMERLIRSGVDGIITNHPDRLLVLLGRPSARVPDPPVPSAIGGPGK